MKLLSITIFIFFLNIAVAHAAESDFERGYNEGKKSTHEGVVVMSIGYDFDPNNSNDARNVLRREKCSDGKLIKVTCEVLNDITVGRNKVCAGLCIP